METDDAIASANALLAATAAREGLCSSPAEIQADGTLKWNSIYCKHYLFGRCARRRCRFVHGDRETVIQQRRLLEIATAAAAEVAAAFDSQAARSTGVTVEEKLRATSASESARSSTIQDATQQFLPPSGSAIRAPTGSGVEVRATRAAEACIVIDSDVGAYRKQKMHSPQQCQSRGVVNVNLTQAVNGLRFPPQHHGGSRAKGCAGRDKTSKEVGGEVSMATCIGSARRGDIIAGANREAKAGRIDHTRPPSAADKHKMASRLLSTGKIRLQPSRSSEDLNRSAIPAERCIRIDVADCPLTQIRFYTSEVRCAPIVSTGESRPLPQTTAFSIMQPQQQRLNRTPSAPCRSQPAEACFRRTLGGAYGPPAAEGSEAIQQILPLASSIQGTGRALGPFAYGIPSALSTVQHRGHYTHEHGVAFSCSTSHVPVASITPRTCSSWRPSSIRVGTSNATPTNPNVFGPLLTARSSALPPVAGFTTAAHKFEVAQGALEGFFPSPSTQRGEAAPSKAGVDAVAQGDFYLLVGDSKARSTPANGLAVSSDQCPLHDSQRRQQNLPSTYKVHDQNTYCVDGGLESKETAICSSATRLSGCDTLIADGHGLELRSPSEHRLSSAARDCSGFLAAGVKVCRKRTAPIGTVEPYTSRLRSSGTEKFSIYRALHQQQQTNLPAMSLPGPEYQRKTSWHTGETYSQTTDLGTTGRDVTLTGDIRFVQAAESLSERYKMPFLCVFVPQRGYVIQFLDGVAPYVRGASGLASSSHDLEHMQRVISCVVKSVLGSSEYALSSSLTPLKRPPHQSVTRGETVDQSTSTAFPLYPTPTATQMAFDAGDRLHVISRQRPAEISEGTASGLLWSVPPLEPPGREAEKTSAETVARDRSSTFIESSGAPTASLLSVLSSLPELELVETKAVEAATHTLQGHQRTEVTEQEPASPLNLTSWLERQPSDAQPTQRPEPSEDRFSTLLNVTAGLNSVGACEGSRSVPNVTANGHQFDSTSAVVRAASGSCSVEAGKNSASQALVELPSTNEALRTLMWQKGVEQVDPLQEVKHGSDTGANAGVTHLMTIGPEDGALAYLQVPKPEHGDGSQQPKAWQLWHTTSHDFRSILCTGQDSCTSDEANASTALGSFWSRTGNGGIFSSHPWKARASETDSQAKVYEDQSTSRRVVHRSTAAGAPAASLRYTSLTGQLERRNVATVSTRARNDTKWFPPDSFQKVFTNAAKVGQGHHAAPRSQSVSCCDGLRTHLSAQTRAERGTCWKRSATADGMSSSPRCSGRGSSRR